MKNKFKSLPVFIVIMLAVTLFVPASALAATGIVVKPLTANGWGILPTGDVAVTTNNATGKVVAGPGGQPEGLLPGSIEYKTSIAPGGKPQLYAPPAVAGVKFSDLTALSYSTYISQYAAGGSHLVHAINIKIDLDGDLTSTTTDRYTLVYEPCYSTSCTGAIQPLNTWGTWDALASGSIWWSTGTIPNTAFVTPFNSFAPLTSIYAEYANAVIVFIEFQAGQGSGGLPWNNFIGNLDGITIGISGNDITYDFEPEPVCTTTCYVDANNGNDANGGASRENAKKTIQAAIDAVNAGGEVHVLPGSYDETATNRYVLGTNGPHQFGLFIDKDGVTIQGVDTNDNAVTDYSSLPAYIKTNATNNFGASGIFVQGDNVTLAGLHIGPNTQGDNKTIEVIGDAFTLKDSHIDVPGGGSIYFNDWQFDNANNTSHVQSYTIDHNLIDKSTSIDLTSGAGFTGPASGRKITNNKFENSEYWPSISFNGSGTGVEWFVQSVGGAVIEGNSFTNTFNGTDVRAAHIRVRGDVDNSQFDWVSYWTNNTFNKAVVILESSPFNVREYNYSSGNYSFDTRRIGVNIQGSVDKAVAGDTVLVKEGIYAESPSINKPLTLKSWAGRDLTTIQLQSGPNYLGALTLDTAGTIVIDGFTIAGFDAAGSGLASTNVALTTLPDNVTIKNNRIKVGAIGTGSNGDDGFGLITYYNEASDIAVLNVTNNIFEPLNTSGARAFYINPGVDQFFFLQNLITGNFIKTAITQAKNGLVEENTLTGIGPAGNRSKGFGTWGDPDPAIYGHTIFRNNTISGVTRGVSINATNAVTVENNFFVDNDIAVWMGDSGALLFNPATIHVTKNSILNNSSVGVQNASLLAGTADATANWWGSNLAADVAGKVSGNVAYNPWLCSGTDTSPNPGFQPTGQTDCSAPIVSSVTFSPLPVYLNALTTLQGVADDTTTGNSTIASAQYKLNSGNWLPLLASDGAFDEPSEGLTAAFMAATLGSNQVCVRATDIWGNVGTPSCATFMVSYKFSGFFQPVDMNAVNISKAGQTVPVKWRLTDANGLPISDPSSFVGLYSYSVSCTDFSGEPPDELEAYSGGSGLQYLGDGYWQFNWKTPKTYANSCRSMYVKLQGFNSPEADFKFKP